jgi:hypothetical protein
MKATTSRSPRAASKSTGAKHKVESNSAENTKANNSKTYDSVKFYDGQQYTGMPVGRSHKWYYDKGEWRETKITPDLWEISYAVTKRRAGKAPKGTGVPKGTEYQWFILAYQHVEKLNLDDYSTSLTGLKYKLSHKRASSDKWNSSAAAQKKRLIAILKDMIADLRKKSLEFKFEYKDKVYKIEAVRLSETCREGTCSEMSISMDNRHLGIIKKRKTGWKMDNAEDPKMIVALGKMIDQLSQDL